MQDFRETFMSCNAWLLTLLVLKNFTHASTCATWKIGSNSCKTMFSQTCGLSDVESGKRDAMHSEHIQLVSNVLTMPVWQGDVKDGKFRKFRRNGEHDPDITSMRPDEIQLLT